MQYKKSGKNVDFNTNLSINVKYSLKMWNRGSLNTNFKVIV